MTCVTSGYSEDYGTLCSSLGLQTNDISVRLKQAIFRVDGFTKPNIKSRCLKFYSFVFLKPYNLITGTTAEVFFLQRKHFINQR